MAEVTIEARPNGPYVVTGTIELHDTNGNVLATQTRTVLCRCGASTKKPFCDGTHSKAAMNQLVPITSATLPALVAAAGKHASMRYLEFFAAQLCGTCTRAGPAPVQRPEVRELEEVLGANPTEPLYVTDLAVAVGASYRALCKRTYLADDAMGMWEE